MIVVFFQQSDVYLFHEIWSGCGYLDRWVGVDKAPRLSISIVTWILSSDTICQLNQLNTNMLSRLVGFPQMITTEWPVGSVQEVAWASRGGD